MFLAKLSPHFMDVFFWIIAMWWLYLSVWFAGRLVEGVVNDWFPIEKA